MSKKSIRQEKEKRVGEPEKVKREPMRHEEDREAEENRWRHILDICPFGIVIISRKGSIEYVNSYIRKQFGDPGEQRCHEYFHGQPEPCSGCQMDTIEKGETVCWQWQSSQNNRIYELFDAPLQNDDGTFSKLEFFRDVTAQVRYQADLKENEHLYRSLFERNHNPIAVIDPEGNYIDANPAFLDFVETTKDKFLRTNAFDWLPSDKLESLTESYKNIWKTGGVLEKEYLVGDRIKILELTVTPIIYKGVDAVIGVGKDITERKRSEAALRRSEEKYRTILESMTDGYFEVDLKGDLTFFNNALCQMLGYSEKELLGMNSKAFMDTDNARKVFDVFNRVYHTGEPYKAFDWALERKDGTVCYVETSVSLIKDDSGPLGFRGVARDVTARKRSQIEQEKLNAQLRHAQKMETIGTLASGIAHDFNNILASVIGFTELSLDLAADETQLERNLVEVLNAGNRAKELVKQILVFSRRDEAELKPILITPLVKEALKMLRSTIPTSINFREKISSEKMIVNASPTQIHQVVVNLATNARQAMGDESGTLEISVAPVEVDGAQADKYPGLVPGIYAQISVKDTGIGISENYLDKIFEPYFTTKEKDLGTGLGLSVVHGIVERHKGHITVSSEPGQGAAFHVFLPTVETQPGATPSMQAGSLPGGRESILLVDDEQSIVGIQAQNLTSLGYRVTTRTSSVEAFEAFRAQPEKFDLVITDMYMPDMTGDRLARMIKTIRPDIPIVLCTGFSERINEYQHEESDINDILLKPADRSELAETVRRVLDDR